MDVAENSTPITPRYIVRNSSGGILGWYRHLRHAEQCREWFERVYAGSGLVGGVEVRICEIGSE
jgi:hypothetical protein